MGRRKNQRKSGSRRREGPSRGKDVNGEPKAPPSERTGKRAVGEIRAGGHKGVTAELMRGVGCCPLEVGPERYRGSQQKKKHFLGVVSKKKEEEGTKKARAKKTGKSSSSPEKGRAKVLVKVDETSRGKPPRNLEGLEGIF